ncbi:MAG: hypothetical protein CMJ64_19595 [Planctomycetaceae bacterium]|jgi:hypothetical protein|nr:hypothetical protein [Planctomycetaceae bacterium]
MPTPFDELRKLAMQRRDKAVQSARRDYHATLEEIAILQSRFVQPRCGGVADAVRALLPVDRPFTLADLMGILKEAGREVSLPVLRTTMHRLEKSGEVRRVVGSHKHRKTVYAIASLECEPPKPTAIKLAEQVLSESDSPMTATEIMVAMLDRGFQPEHGLT